MSSLNDSADEIDAADLLSSAQIKIYLKYMEKRITDNIVTGLKSQIDSSCESIVDSKLRRICSCDQLKSIDDGSTSKYSGTISSVVTKESISISFDILFSKRSIDKALSIMTEIICLRLL